ncbi:hypothetical protein BGX27_009350 [Mortierella sp. AM989]|nr:hypothetical protein BGX27_009350 [Mortierella sp. AM989]
MSEHSSVEDLKARLDVCRQQLEGSSVLNTAKRKDTLREEIHSIESQIARALGLNDDEDETDEETDNDEIELSTDHIEQDDLDTPESAHLPPINSPGVTRSPSPILMNPAKKLKVECKVSGIETPPISHLHISNNNDFAIGSSSSSSGSSSIHAVEAESVWSALLDAGEEDLDLESLLKEQAMMEQRIADLKRRREEEDEVFARSIQEEEIQTFHRQGIPSSSSSSSSTNIKATMQPKLDRARQEREDAEMARIFAESDTSTSINLAAPLRNTTQQNGAISTNSPYPVFHIFERNTSKAISAIPSSSSSSSFNINQPFPANTTAFGSTPVFSIAPSIIGSIQGQAATALVSVAEGSRRIPQLSTLHPAHQIQQMAQRALQQSPRTDLTRSVIDLTNRELDTSSSEDEVQYISSSQSSSNWAINDPIVPQYYGIHGNSGTWSRLGGYHSDHSNDDEDDWDDVDDESLLLGFSQWENEMLRSWNRRIDYARNISSADSERELRELLANVQATEEDIAPQDRTGTPDGMASSIVLLEHQKIGLTWLQKMEDGTNRGGILGDDMGLGKTIQTMALIVSRPCGPIDDPVIWDASKTYYEPPPENMLVKTKATLVLAPVALMFQWAEEIRSKTQPGLLKVYVYHGKDKFIDPEMLRRYDVIITTVTTLAVEVGVKDANLAKCKPIGTLFKAHFHRVVIDEAHLIKNKLTKSAKACTMLAATYRWCLTGTPVQNSIDELFSLIRFLRIKPYCDWDEFRSKISAPMKRSQHYERAMQRVQALLKAICLRRTKTSQVDGKPILNLPERRVDRVATEFSLDERAFYEALETRTRERFNAYVKAGTVMKNYSNILVLLLRLRQACCHPHLINDFEKAMDELTPRDQRAHVDRLLDNLLDDIRHRLIERGLDAVECPICMDVGEESVILSGCGHIYCRACIIAHLSRHDEDDRKCPECRRVSRIDNLISIADFNARFNAPIPEDPKGKGKALDQIEDLLGDKLPDVEIPETLDEWISSSKIDKMIDVVRSVMAKGEKIIVFSQFTSLLTLIEKPLISEQIKYLRYDGAMTPEKRNEAVRRMINDPTYPVMLISLKCGSLGLNLTVANHVVIMDPWWNPSLENQAIDRVHRIGQTKDVRVHRLCIPNTVEDRILALQSKKQALADGALGEGEVPKLAKLGVCIFIYPGGYVLIESQRF